MIRLISVAVSFAILFAFEPTCIGQSLVMRVPGSGTSAYYQFESQTKKPDGGVHKSNGRFIIRRLKSVQHDTKTFVWLEIEQTIEFESDPVTLVTKILVPRTNADLGGIDIRTAKKIWHSSSVYKDGVPELFDPKSRRAEYLLNFFPPKSITKTAGKPIFVKTPIGNLKCKSLKGSWTQTTEASGTYKRNISVLTNDQVPFGTVQLEFDDSINKTKMTGKLTLTKVGMNEKSALPKSW